MRITIGLAKVFTLLTMLAVLFQQAAYAQTARTFAKKPITVRLCPSTCRAVNGHGFVPGGKASVFESRSGWARVSAYLDRKALVPSFGSKITQKPALWVPLSSLVSNKAAAKPKPTKKAAAKPKPVKKKQRKVAKRVSVVDRIARLRRIPRPVYRPNSNYRQATVAEPIVTTEPVTAPAVVTEAPKVVVTEPVAKPVVVESTPVVVQSGGDDSQRKLTWEEVQAKIAAQAAGKQAPAAPAKKVVIQPSEAEKAAAAERAKAAAEAKRVKAAKDAADAAKKSEAESAAKATKLAAEKAKAAKAAQKAAEAAKQAESAKVAVVLPPKKAEPVESTKEPEFKSAKADPIALGPRPKKLTKKLMDKRLRKLPGRKSKMRKDVVIAMRHYALGLLNSGECKGIAKGGASAIPGMLYVACTEDPTYLRQFPLVEESW